ncbi:MAG: TlpA disulfide reductase family protein [Flavobacteriaceae bacterium]
MGLLFITTLLFVSCKEGNKTDVSKMEDLHPKEFISKVPVVNYNELETNYFHPEPSEVYVVNFWATWCKPCVKELPAFEKLNEQYRKQGVKVLLVSLDFPDKLEKGVLPFLEKNQIQSDVVLLDDPDANNWIPKISEQWSGAIPATLVLHDGKRFFFEQSFTYETLESEIKPFL